MTVKIKSPRQNFNPQNRPRVPYCPHCTSQTMHLDRAGTRWQCASSACGFTMPVIAEPRPVRFAEVA